MSEKQQQNTLQNKSQYPQRDRKNIPTKQGKYAILFYFILFFPNILRGKIISHLRNNDVNE